MPRSSKTRAAAPPAPKQPLKKTKKTAPKNIVSKIEESEPAPSAPKVVRALAAAEDEESSSFSFEEESASASSSAISSSHTDDVLPLAIDAATLATTQEKLKNRRPMPVAHPERGVIYLGHLPYGFFEAQMRDFFSQFGTVTRVKLSRNKKSNHTRHYAFVEFMEPEVARIVADTMDNYMMYHKMIVCKVVPPEKVHPLTFMRTSRLKNKKRANQLHRKAVNRRRTPEEHAALITKLLAKESERKQRLADLGIDYEPPAPVAAPLPAGADSTPSSTATATPLPADTEKSPKGSEKKQKSEPNRKAKASASPLRNSRSKK